MKGTFYFLKDVDMFSEPVPSFNINGRTHIRTWLGACISVQILLIVMAFSVQKLQHLFMRKNPLINTNKFPLDVGTTYKLDQDEFMLAVAAESYDNNEYLSDPRYVRWVTALWEKKAGKMTQSWYLMHKCRDEEFEKFKPA